MRIRLLSPTNIRVSPSNHALPLIGVLYAGVEMEVENRLYRGYAIDGIDTYFRDEKGWYYWSGRAVILYKALPSPKPETAETAEEIGGNWELDLQAEPIKQVDKLQPTSPIPQPASPSFAAGSPLPSNQEDVPLEQPITPSFPPEASPSRSVFAPDRGFSPQEEITPQPRNQPAREANFQHRAGLKNWALADLGIPALFWENIRILGRGVRIALLGTGIDSEHPDFSDRIKETANFCFPNQPVRDEDGLGSAGAGILAGAGAQEWLGVAPQADLMIGKIMDNTLGVEYQRLIQALDWCDRQRPDILVFCFDFRADSINGDQRQKIQVLIDKISNAGTLCVAPVGDGAGSRPENRWPACLESCLSIGAIDRNHQRIPSSLRSYTLNIMAPGEGLLNSGPEPAATTQAALFTAGILALALEFADRNQIRLDAAAWINLLKDTASPKYAITKCRDMEYGCGLINPAAMLEVLKTMKT